LHNSHKRVLLADDQLAGREFVRATLEAVGYLVVEAVDGEAALAAARSIAPDLILLDIHMPLRDGLSVVKELRSDPRFQSVPILALTATAMKGDRQKGLDAGFTEYLTKPLSVGALREVIARFL
jgi:two-component system cell cycle response regulator DivK